MTKPEPVREQALKARARPKPPRQNPKKEEPVQAVKPEPDERKRLEDERRASQQAAREAKQSLVSILVAQMNRYKRYPSSARKLGLEGVVPVHVTIDGQGRITSISLAGGDVHPALQKAAAETMAKVRGNWKPPAVTQGISVTVPMRFSLRDG